MTISDDLRKLLESYAEPCVGDCEHSQCPLLRELHALRIKATLEQARLTVKPIVDKEREGEQVGDLMNMRLHSPVAATVNDECHREKDGCSYAGRVINGKWVCVNHRKSKQAAAPSVTAPVGTAEPIDMILFCPRCGTHHIDVPEDETAFRHRMEAFSLVAEPQDSYPSRWTNPPHKSHLCHNCYAVWRPADVPTNGVAHIKTRGKDDNTWTNSAAVPATTSTTPVDGEREP